MNPNIKIFDSLIASHILDENTPNGLKYLASACLDIPHQNIKDWGDVCGNVHSQEFYDYAMQDAEWTWQLKELFTPRLEKEGLSHVFYNIEMPFIFCLRDMELNGVLLDLDKLTELRTKLVLQVEGLQTELCKLADVDYFYQYLMDNSKELICEFNWNSPQQLSKLLQEKFHLNLGKPSKAGFCSVDKKALNKHKSNEFVKILIEYRDAMNMLSKFLDKLPGFIKADGRVHTSFRNTLKTGRLSSSNPPMQQLPKDNTGPVKIRECIVSPPGYSLIVCDYSGQELRVLAEESGDMTMIDAFYKNQDLHLTTANKFFNLNIPDEVLIVGHPLHEETKKKYKTERDKSKVINFGISYGKTAYGFSKDWAISKEEAQKFIDRYFEGFPDVKKRIDKCHLDLRNNGYVVNLAGRRRRFPGYAGADKYVRSRIERQAFNFLIQGFSADLGKKAAIDVRNLCLKHPEWNCRLILAIHDEFLYECKNEYCETATKQIKTIMESSTQLSLPLIIDINYGANYSAAKP